MKSLGCCEVLQQPGGFYKERDRVYRMRRLDFNKGWSYRHLGTEEEEIRVSIPHDAMLSEPRSELSAGGGNIGWFEGKDYIYTKHFDVPGEWEKKCVILEFEGVYHNAEVYINRKKTAFRPYGYTNFYVDAAPFLDYGAENVVEVIARNSDQPNSRWYSGSGIYRPVSLYVADQEHILLNGVKIRTLGIRPALVEIAVSVSGTGPVKAEIFHEGERVCSANGDTDADGKTVLQAEIPDALLWDSEHPNLYTCQVSYGNDTAIETFGVRTLSWSPETGLTVNGKRVILRGACIHHDNGILGACAYPEAEERKLRILKENGYNAVRSAHNPCSKAMLDACDRLGMYMMDEYVDVWYIHKTEYDYVRYFKEWWHQDLKDMVDKDYNHPSVILYSTGNEVSETAQKKGIGLTGLMTDYLHKLDDTRPVTCGINIFFNLLSSLGFGVYSDEKAKKQADAARQKEADAAARSMAGTKREVDAGRQNADAGKKEKKKKPVGSEFYNTLAGLLGDKTMKMGATLHGCDVKTRDAFANMDIAGYNYGILRYRHDLKKYPGRLILGSETFCKDAYTFWEMAKKFPAIIGDFVWAGMDYMGEVAVGSWEYEDYAPKNGSPAGWISAGSGRVNLIGTPLGEAAYTKVALERSDRPAIAVRPVYQTGKHSPSAWKMTDAMESWSYRGCDGYKAIVEVYARGYEAELFINGRSAGRKRFANDCRVIFKTVYHNGEVTAVIYDKQGKETGRTSLKTAGKETVLRATPETVAVKKDRLCFIHLEYTDSEGIRKPMKRGILHAEVTGGTLVGLGNACPYNPEGYLKDYTDTYYGEALAVVRADGEGDVILTVKDGKHMGKAVIPVIE